MSGSGRWADLGPRLASATVMGLVAGFAVWTGGPLFEGFIALVCAAMIWELARMLAPGRSRSAPGLAALSALAVFADPQLQLTMGLTMGLAVLAVPALAGLVLLGERRGLFALFALWIAFAGHGFITIRADLGIAGILWLICVVAATDIAGYFAGKGLGGPKLWPRVSPNKTWSGTVAGWFAAALVGYGFAVHVGHDLGGVVLSVLVACASQAGDIAESAIKRQAGIKDSSHLIPGHGGFLDRFDGMMGAAVFVLVAGLLLGLRTGAI